MADAGDIAIVRANVNEPTAERFSDEVIGILVDESGVTGATAALWRRKAAIYADLVNTTEAGASRALSDLNKHALAMATTWAKIETEESVVLDGGKLRARTHRIERA